MTLSDKNMARKICVFQIPLGKNLRKKFSEKNGLCKKMVSAKKKFFKRSKTLTNKEKHERQSKATKKVKTAIYSTVNQICVLTALSQ